MTIQKLSNQALNLAVVFACVCKIGPEIGSFFLERASKNKNVDFIDSCFRKFLFSLYIDFDCH